MMWCVAFFPPSLRGAERRSHLGKQDRALLGCFGLLRSPRDDGVIVGSKNTNVSRNGGALVEPPWVQKNAEDALSLHDTKT